MKRTVFFFLALVLSIPVLTAQRDCPQVDCPGICGRFVDADGDGFCDHGQLSAKKSDEAPALQSAQTTKTPEQKTAIEAGSEETAITQENAGVTPEAKASQKDIIAEDATENVTEANETPAKPAKPFRYPLFTLIGCVVGLYAVTSILVKAGKMEKSTHRKIWNMVLGISCLASCLIGLLLALFLNYGQRPACYINLLHWHVYFGIVMTVVAIFHIIWHIGYFKAIFKSKKQQ
ncbi:MAG: hypothetical protein J6S87_09575 [Bacteroidales bacterium]|nr:hypothetical protein [Bacteroidales bacterium]